MFKLAIVVNAEGAGDYDRAFGEDRIVFGFSVGNRGVADNRVCGIVERVACRFCNGGSRGDKFKRASAVNSHARTVENNRIAVKFNSSAVAHGETAGYLQRVAVRNCKRAAKRGVRNVGNSAFVDSYKFKRLIVNRLQTNFIAVAVIDSFEVAYVDNAAFVLELNTERAALVGDNDNSF